MAINDRTATKEITAPGQIDLAHVYDQIHYDRRTFTPLANPNELSNAQLEQKGILPYCRVE